MGTTISQRCQKDSISGGPATVVGGKCNIGFRGQRSNWLEQAVKNATETQVIAGNNQDLQCSISELGASLAIGHFIRYTVHAVE